MKIAKFGGSILKNSTDITLIKNTIEQDFLSKETSIYVFSAFYGITNRLVELFNSLRDDNESKRILSEIKIFHLSLSQELGIKNSSIIDIFTEFELKIKFFQQRTPSAKIKDYIISLGEILSSKIIFAYLKQFLEIEYLDSADLIKTDNNFNAANVDCKVTHQLIENAINKEKYYICAGFIASTKDGEISTLGRNGSDYSAAIFGSAIKAKKVDIWKDVDGVFTADPKIVNSAKKINYVSYREMSELCYFGAKVIYLDALYPLLTLNIPIEIKNLYSNNSGTVISDKNSNLSVVGISNMKVTIISVSGFEKYQDKFTTTSKIIEELLNAKVEIIGSFQFSSILSFTIIVQYTENTTIDNILDKIKFNSSLNVQYEQNSSVVAVIGANMIKTSGILGKIFNALSTQNISVDSCVTGFDDINICFSLPDQDKNKALEVIHASIFEA